jgi:hypothetical protein
LSARKIDARDAEWIAYLVRYGLIAKKLREMRELLRYRPPADGGASGS